MVLNPTEQTAEIVVFLLKTRIFLQKKWIFPHPENPYPPNLGGEDFTPQIWGVSARKHSKISDFWRFTPQIWGVNLHPPNLGGMGFQGSKMHFRGQMLFFRGHMAGNRRKLQEGFGAQESRTLANFHKRPCIPKWLLRSCFWPPPPTPDFLSKDFCLQPGLEWKFLLSRTWLGRKLLPLQFRALPLP